MTYPPSPNSRTIDKMLDVSIMFSRLIMLKLWKTVTNIINIPDLTILRITVLVKILRLFFTIIFLDFPPAEITLLVRNY